MRIKKTFKWILIVLLSPVVLFLVLTALLYVPFIQNWVAQQVVSYASKQTGYEITVEHVDLDFPLDLGVDGIRIATPTDTVIADIQRAVVDVKLWPLLKGNVVLDALELRGAKLNTMDMIGDMRLEGEIGCLTLTSPGIDVERMEMELRGPRLSDTNLTIFMSDTAAVDTSTAGWRVRFDRFDLERTCIAVVMDSAALFPDTAMHINACMPVGRIEHADLDLGVGRFAFGPINWEEGSASYGNMASLSNVNLSLDSLYYYGDQLHVGIRQASLREDSLQLSVDELSGTVAMDGDQITLGRLKGIASAQWDDKPLTVHASVDGNLDQLNVEQLSVSIPTVMHAEATGTLANIMDMERMKANLQLKADGYDLSKLSMVKSLAPDIRLPKGLKLQGDIATNDGKAVADLSLRDGGGLARVKGSYNLVSSAVDAKLSLRQFNLRHFMPADSLGLLTADAQLRADGSWKRMEAEVQLHSMQYGHWHIDSTYAKGTLNNGHLLATMESRNNVLGGTATIDAQLGSNSVTGTINANMDAVDLYALGMADAPTVVGMNTTIDIDSDLKDKHRFSALATNIYIRDSVQTLHPENLGVLLKAGRDTTTVRMQSGDLIVKFDGRQGYEQLFASVGALADNISTQLRNRTIDQPQLKMLLPEGHLYATSQRDNPLANLLHSSMGIDFQHLHVDLTTSPVTGVNGTARLLGLSSGDMLIDTMRISLVEKTQGLTFNGQVTNSRRNKMATFNILFDGRLQEHGASFGVRYFDEKGLLNIRIGSKAEMVELPSATDENATGIRFQLIPSRPTLGYKEFELNSDNYLLLHDDMKIEANVDLKADDGTHLKIYSADQDSTLLQDLTISVHQMNLGELTEGISLLPNIAGTLEGDFHLMTDQQHNTSVASDIHVDQMVYEGSPIGNLGSEFVYLLREDGSHAVDGTLALDDEEIGTLQGSYTGNGMLDATLQLNAMPLSMANGFMPDQLLGFEGTADGTLSMKGAMDDLKMNGELRVSSGYLFSTPYGMRMRFGDTPVQIKDSRLLFDDFALYSYNDNPLNISGSVDFNESSQSAVDLRLRARNFQLINAKQQKESVAYGRMFVNFFARLSGNLDQLSMRGRLDVLGTTDLNYILLDSPLSTDNQMDELVRFTDFSDTIQAVVLRPESEALDLDMQLSIDQGAHVRCALNADQTNYVDLLGGGDLRLRMDTEGMNLSGRYTVENGTMKYSLPIIPLKTFTISQGSFVEFTGDPANPTLNLTATERRRTQVTSSDGQPRTVAFDCGVVITQTLENMGLQFIISSPEDMQVQNELSSMSLEHRGKLAVTMLTTGMYLNDGNTGSFSMNSALSSFLQSEINNITAGALKTVDLQLGLDNSTDATGQTHTDYSFRFAKRFWNNRLNVQIGGKVSTGADVQGQQQSFFDNVTMEYRLSPTSNKYVKLFYNQNVYDWLEGYTGEYGGGFIWKRKLDSLFDIFKPTKRLIANPSLRERNLGRTVAPVSSQDSIPQNDSIK